MQVIHLSYSTFIKVVPSMVGCVVGLDFEKHCVLKNAGSNSFTKLSSQPSKCLGPRALPASPPTILTRTLLLDISFQLSSFLTLTTLRLSLITKMLSQQPTWIEMDSNNGCKITKTITELGGFTSGTVLVKDPCSRILHPRTDCRLGC